MTILTVAAVAGGGFSAGMIVGALVLSPRLITRTDVPPPPPREAVYVLPGAPGVPGSQPPILPPGYTVIPAASPMVIATGESGAGTGPRSAIGAGQVPQSDVYDRDHDARQAVRWGVHPAHPTGAPAAASAPREVELP